jgi:glucose-6-phosphate 1-dehydrogenase
MPRRPGTSSSDFSFGLFVATCTAGALGLLLLGASAAAFLEAGGGADPAASAGFWLSLAGNAIGVLASTVVACLLGSRARSPRAVPQAQRRGGASGNSRSREKVVPSGMATAAAASGVGRSRSLRASPKSKARISREKQSSAYKGFPLEVIVVGASGDLAKKKTYPSLLELMEGGYMPPDTKIWGYARSDLGRDGLHERLRPFLLKSSPPDTVDRFLELCFYHRGSGYEDTPSWTALSQILDDNNGKGPLPNRVFYFAIPPSAFGPAGAAIKASGIMVTPDADNDVFNRFVIEKPFGRDSESSAALAKELTALFREDQLYRIDHYLGKDMVQNVLSLRCSNALFGDDVVWNRAHIKCVIISWKEAIGTMGRGGYFDTYGIIRDVMQNHLLQVLSVVAMEAPENVHSASSVRDAKVALLKCVAPLTLDDVVLGQYTRGKNADTGEEEPGYLEDATVPTGSNCPTFAQARFSIDNDRWRGVPFVIKAGKALSGKKCEVRVQFTTPTATSFDGDTVPPNELVLRIQPNPSIYLKMNIKQPGLGSRLLQTEMDLTYDDSRHRARMGKAKIPGAYTRLLLDVLRGEQSCFVRSDELEEAWKIFTPLLHRIEAEKVVPEAYEAGSRGPARAQARMREVYTRSEGYEWEEEEEEEEEEARAETGKGAAGAGGGGGGEGKGSAAGALGHDEELWADSWDDHQQRRPEQAKAVKISGRSKVL